MIIPEIKAAMNALLEQINAVADKEKAGEKLSADDIANFESLTTEHSELQAKLSRLEKAQNLAVQTATKIDDTGLTNAPALNLRKPPEDYPGSKMARIALALMAADCNVSEASKFAQKELLDKDVAMSLSTASDSGGSLVPEAYSRDFIELLRPQLVVSQMGARVVMLPKGKLTLSRQSGGATSSFRGEGQKVNASNVKTEPVKLNAKSQMTIVPITKEFKGRADIDAEKFVLDDMLAAHAQCQDLAFLRGDGTNDMPKGLLTIATEAGRLVPYVGDVELSIIDAYLDSLILAHKNSNSKMLSCGWIVSPRTWMKLYGLRNAQGIKVYPEMESGTLKRYPIRDTTNVPSNLGVGGDLSEIYFNAFNDVVIGYDPMFDINTSEDATYYDSDGNIQSAYANGEIVIRLMGASDIITRHPEGVVQGTEIPF
ncbi:phage major capsid protein [Pseudoalteromonas rhizosphaerae]|uniref:phage major capsid protein n=1 Tax=Pseudoalteromonas rhizosphaerae TaxID=2518973 RepID=UPI001230F29B|nr:phage major capsid protein [Pseudoalteromonas rhizosphaerae]